MANRHETGEEFLRRNGVPEGILGLPEPSGLQPDYLNNYVGPEWVFDARYNPSQPNNHLDEEDAEDKIRGLLKGVPKYTQYWKDRIDNYNQRAEDPVEPQSTLDLVTGKSDLAAALNLSSSTETLDLFADRLHGMAEDPRLTPKQLVQGFVVFDANARIVFDGKVGPANKLREKFGFGKHPRRRT